MQNNLISLLLALACATIEVGPGKHPTVASAVAIAAPGDTIQIAPGEYVGATRVKVPLHFRGSGTLSGKGLNLNGSGAVPRALLEFAESAEGSTVEGLTFLDATNKGTNAAGIRLIGTPVVTIRDCTFRRCDNGLFTSGENCKRLLVDFCRFINNGNSATSHNVYLSNGESAMFLRCLFAGTNQGQNLKSRVRFLYAIGCTFQDSKNRELDLVESDGTTEPGGFAVISKCRIVKRWCNIENDGSYTYVQDQSRRPANQHVIQFGADVGGVNAGTLYLIGNTIVTPYPQPVVSLTSTGRLVADGNTVIRPTGTYNQGTVQRFVRIGDEAKVSGRGNVIPITFTDRGAY